MRYLSVCAGIEAATVAWHHLGWQAAAYSEIDKFPLAVLAHHYPAVPLHGDFTTIEGREYGSIDILAGGTPCQDFSVAGKRAGLGGARGNLTLEFARLAGRCGARWLVWENVPGCFSLNNGRDFGAVAACFAGHPEGTVFDPPVDGWQNSGIAPAAGPDGYGLAWRVLDAQFAGVPQRRRRLIVVGYIGDWRPAAAVLLERESLLGNPPPRREAGERTAPTLAARTRGGGGLGTDFDCDGGPIANTLSAARGAACANAADLETYIPVVSPTLAGSGNATGGDRPPGTTVDTADSLVVQPFADVADPIAANQARTYTREGKNNFRVSNVVAVAFKPSHFTRGKDGAPSEIAPPLSADADKGDQDTLVFDTTQVTSKANYSQPKPGDPCHPLAAGAHPPAIAFTAKDYGADAGDIAPTLRGGSHDKSHANGGVMPAVAFSIMPQNSGKDYKARQVDVVQPLMAGGPVTGNQGGDVILQPVPAVAFTQNARSEVRQIGGDGQIVGALSAEPGAQQQTYIAAFEARFARNGRGAPDNIVPPLKAQSGGSGKGDGAPLMATATMVRRLTPRECERLQGFPDDYTLIPYRGKPAADGPRYKALGNSWAVPVFRWVGERIALVDAIV
jgi:DNA (cytosine-5)-methyltransferase 1